MGANPPAPGPPPPPKPQPMWRGDPKKEFQKERVEDVFPPWVARNYILVVLVVAVVKTVILLLI